MSYLPLVCDREYFDTRFRLIFDFASIQLGNVAKERNTESHVSETYLAPGEILSS